MLPVAEDTGLAEAAAEVGGARRQARAWACCEEGEGGRWGGKECYRPPVERRVQALLHGGCCRASSPTSRADVQVGTAYRIQGVPGPVHTLTAHPHHPAAATLRRAGSACRACCTCPQSAAAGWTQCQCRGRALARAPRSGMLWSRAQRRCCWMWRRWRSGKSIQALAHSPVAAVPLCSVAHSTLLANAAYRAAARQVLPASQRHLPNSHNPATPKHARRLNKPLSCRLLPVPGARAGDATRFTSPYLVNCRVMEL